MLVAAASGEVAGITLITEAPWPGTGAETAAIPGSVRRVAASRVKRGRGGRGAGGAGQLQGAVEAGTEPVGEQFVGLAGGGGGRVVARVGGAEPQRQHRDGQHDHRGGGGGGQLGRVALDEPGQPRPPGGRAVAGGAVSGQPPAFPAGQHPHPEEAQQRGQQGDGGGHREQHRDRRGDAQAGDVADAQHQHPEQGDAYRGAGEQDRASRGVQRAGRRVLGGHPGLDVVAVPGDDEQRVVDAHAQPDQDAQRRADRGNADRVRGQADRQQAGGQPGDRDRQRQQHGQQRAERDEQHHRRGDHPDGGADADRGPQRVLDRLPAQVDLQAGGPGRFGEVDDAGDLGCGQAVRLGVEDHGGVGDLPVAADLGGAAGRVRADHRGHPGRGGDPGQHGRDPGPYRRGAYVAAAGPPHDRVLVSGVPGERLFLQVQRGRGAGAGQGERIGVRGPRRPAARPQDHQQR